MEEKTGKRIWKVLPIVVTAFLYLILVSIYNVVTPLWETPDEPGHFDYVVHLLQHRALPQMAVGHLDESHQPPLYYALTALIISPVDLSDSTGVLRPNPHFVYAEQGGRDVNLGLHDDSEFEFPYRGWALALHVARAFSSLLGLGTVLFTYAIAQTIFPDNLVVPPLSAALVAFNPQFLFITAAVNNDSLVVFTTAGLLWQTVTLLRHRGRSPLTTRDGLALGGWILAILMAKLSSLAVIGLAVAALLVMGWQNHHLKPGVQSLALTALIAVAGSLWWWLRNQVLYGDPLGLKMFNQVFRVLLHTTLLTTGDWPAFFRTQFRSFWGIFGWMNVYAPEWYYILCAWGSIVAVVGWLPRLFRRNLELVQRWLLGFLLTATLAQEAYAIVLAYQANESRWQGRYLFPVIAPLAILLAYGVTGWVPRRWERYMAWAISLGLLGLAVYMPLCVIWPAYLPQPTIDQVSISHPRQATFGDQFLLHGYDLEQEPLAVTLTLYWEALRVPDFDYSVFVHLTDQTGELLGQQDHAPGSDRNHPPTTWKPGEVIADPHRIPLLRPIQGTLQIRVGVYNWATGERMTIFTEDEFPMGDSILLQVESPSNQVLVFLLAGGGLVAVSMVVYFLWIRRSAQGV
ncbi:MAG: hypothetical protein SXV54_05935 [Chloroflexota bacterium]|nr:hypothetical protein [Chloroflexota bacterium]